MDGKIWCQPRRSIHYKTDSTYQHCSKNEHISPSIWLSQRLLQVMFCFAGLVGMGLESRRMRNWLAHSIFASSQYSDLPQEAIEEPQSYRGSFNPFPALVIGVTGAAMAAHFQTYLFQAGIQFHCDNHWTYPQFYDRFKSMLSGETCLSHLQFCAVWRTFSSGLGPQSQCYLHGHQLRRLAVFS